MDILLKTIILSYLGCVLKYSFAANLDPIVQTQYGKVKGTLRNAIGSSRPVYSYFGVQYGRSPDYVFRFRPAEDPWTWDGVRDATNENRPMCVQDRVRLNGLRKDTYLKYLLPDNPLMSENCLVLDIFTPRSPNDTKRDNLLPVVLWIHGGSMDAFFSTTKLWGLPAFEDVVLVQIQYRLGVFGFLTTEDKWAPPNNAFHDHLKAMKWVQKNIEAFGGNPNLVTLMGESAGAVAATAHTLIPESKGLFHRVFATSGAPNSMVWPKTYGDAIERMAKNVSCKFDDNAYTSTCLRNKISTSRIMKLVKDMDINFKMLEDRDLFPVPINEAIETKTFVSSVPVMMGVMNGEQNYLLSRRVFSNIYLKGPDLTRSEAESALRNLFHDRYQSGNVDAILKAVTLEYLDPKKVGNKGMKLYKGTMEAIADCWFVSKSARFAEKVKESGQRAYFFEFTLKPAMYDARPKDFPRLFKFDTADHADDFPYMFGLPFVRELAGGDNPALYFSDIDKEISKKFMHLIAHFAKTGSPPEELGWPQYPRYAVINKGITISKDNFQSNRMYFWNEVIPKLAFP
ncbi:fatty acyl-CoA hydrolase precursor, medium chain-like [Styela clava]